MNFKSFGAPSLEAEKSFSFAELERLLGDALYGLRDKLLDESKPNKPEETTTQWNELVENARALEQSLETENYTFPDINEQALKDFLTKVRESRGTSSFKAAVALLLQAYMRIEQA